MDQTHQQLCLSLDFGAASRYQKVYKKKSNKRKESEALDVPRGTLMTMHSHPSSKTRKRSNHCDFARFVPAIKDEIIQCKAYIRRHAAILVDLLFPVESFHISNWNAILPSRTSLHSHYL
eukprot:981141_1